MGLTACAGLAFFAPNTQQILAAARPRIEAFLSPGEAAAPGWLSWRPTTAWAVMLALLFLVIVTQLSNATDFLYFQF